jgi:glyoxylase-like metal-dependent hydrolase (beta-lactamase superfamily II)
VVSSKIIKLRAKEERAMRGTIPIPLVITPHLFQLGLPSFPVYLSWGTEGMLIEGGTGSTTDIIVKQIAMLGIDVSKIRYLCLTHTHFDHVGAVPRLRQLWSHLKVLTGAAGAALLQKDTFVQEFVPHDRMIGDILIGRGDIVAHPSSLDAYNFLADYILEEGEKIDLGAGIIWHVFPTPGHSACHISLVEEHENIMAIGDMTGYFDPAMDVFWPNYFSSLDDYCASMEKMTAVYATRGLLSHNGVIEGDMREHLAKALRATEAYHHALLQRLDHGEEIERICTDTTDWICNSLGALASYKVIHFLCKVMVRHSMAARGKDLFHLYRIHAPERQKEPRVYG